MNRLRDKVRELAVPELRPLRGERSHVRLMLTLGRLCFHAPWAECGFSNSTSFSLPGSTTVGTFLQPSLPPLLRPFMRGGAAGGI